MTSLEFGFLYCIFITALIIIVVGKSMRRNRGNKANRTNRVMKKYHHKGE